MKYEFLIEQIKPAQEFCEQCEQWFTPTWNSCKCAERGAKEWSKKFRALIDNEEKMQELITSVRQKNEIFALLSKIKKEIGVEAFEQEHDCQILNYSILDPSFNSIILTTKIFKGRQFISMGISTEELDKTNDETIREMFIKNFSKARKVFLNKMESGNE